MKSCRLPSRYKFLALFIIVMCTNRCLYPVIILHYIEYIPRNMHTVFALLCFVVVIHRLIFPYPSGLLHWHCGNLTIAPVPAKQPWWIWINTSCELIMNDCKTTTIQSTTKPCAYFLGYTVSHNYGLHIFQANNAYQGLFLEVTSVFIHFTICIRYLLHIIIHVLSLPHW